MQMPKWRGIEDVLYEKRRFVVDVRDNKDVALPNRFFPFNENFPSFLHPKSKMVMKKLFFFSVYPLEYTL